MRKLITLLAFINSFSIVFAQDTLKIGKFEVINLDLVERKIEEGGY
jgi:hypothetical protein